MTQQIPEGAQRSEDGNYWWDGSAWQLIDQSGGGGAAAGGQDASQGGGGIQIDLQQFPGLWRLSQTDPSDAGVDQYLAGLGIDPNAHSDSDTATA
jgi:hypothetical protein